MAAKDRVMKNTVQGAVLTAKMVSAKIEPMYKLDGDELTYFNAVVTSRETATWNDNHRLLATNLAVTYGQLDEANMEIAERGLMVKNDRGTPVVNPAITAKSSLSATVLQLNKALGLSASQMGVSGQAQDKRNKADADARAVISQISETDLI
jgi:phage terminase small subunit